MALTFRFETEPGAFEKAILAKQTPILRAASAALGDAAKVAVKAGREEILAAGLGSKMANGLRYKYISERGELAVLLYHRFGFISVFQYGSHIAGKPLLWLPLSNVPTKHGGRPLTPRAVQAQYGQLVSIERPGKPPMLGIRVPVTKSGRIPKLTASKLRPGSRVGKAAAVRVIPVFVGVDAADIGRRLDLLSIFKRAGDLIGTLYLRDLKDN